MAKSIAYGKKIKVYPLAQADNPPPTVFTDVKDVLFDSTIRYDSTFFEPSNRIVQNEPWLTRDNAMIDPLRTLGIEKGKPFKPDAETRFQLDAAAVRRRRSSTMATTAAGERSSRGPTGGPWRQQSSRKPPLPASQSLMLTRRISAASPIRSPSSASSGSGPGNST